MTELELIERARTGDEAAFGKLIAPHMPPLRSFLLRLVANPDDAADLSQDVAIKAFEKLSSFRSESTFRTWLFAIASNIGLNHLERRKRRWPVEGQLQMHERAEADEAFRNALGAELSADDFRYDVAEHIAYCFSCVGRSLPPQDSAALLLREVFEFKNREGAKILGLTESVFRHRVAAARAHMKDAYDGLCALVGKSGVCHQCAELRELAPPDRQGLPPLPLSGANSDAKLETRLRVVRDADVTGGTTSRLHGVMLRFISEHLG